MNVPRMTIGVTGATGFIGKALVPALERAGHTVRKISTRGEIADDALAGCNAVVNLAGEPVAQRWTPEAKDRIRRSRVEGTRRLVDAMRPNRVQILVSGSAVGYYGSCGDKVLTEAEPPAQDFLGETAAEWEREAVWAEDFGVRVSRLRTGMVLGPDGGALAKMLLPFKLGLGGPIAGGQQWMSWIHIEDLANMILFLIEEPTLRGPYNGVAPNPVTNADFTKALGSALHRPTIIPVPEFAVKKLFGEMSQIVLASQRAIPDAANRAGFTFKYPEIHGALTHVLSK